MITYDRLMQPLMNALFDLGGSGSNEETYEKVVEREKFDEEMLSVLHDPERGSTTEIAYRLAWARSYLKKTGYLENSSRGVWALTEKGRANPTVDSDEIVFTVREAYKAKKQDKVASIKDRDLTAEPLPGLEMDEQDAWRGDLHHVLIDEMEPDAFERLTQRILRESGFIQVEVTGRSGDGGIDGKGIARINGMMSFRIAFQCKKYKSSVTASDIRDFRGATVGRADRALFITTGRFTRGAIDEANREGASPIDLIDGVELADKLKELSLGVKTEQVEKVTIDRNWFLNL